jgi:hypothetical protein
MKNKIKNKYSEKNHEKRRKKEKSYLNVVASEAKERKKISLSILIKKKTKGIKEERRRRHTQAWR